jgi:hypothetical protein
VDAVDARNKSLHAYHEELAERLSEDIPLYVATMQTVLEKMPYPPSVL